MMGTCCVTRKLKDPSRKIMPQTTQLWHNGKDKILHPFTRWDKQIKKNDGYRCETRKLEDSRNTMPLTTQLWHNGKTLIRFYMT
jgi:hypothetical protein